jgi:hypothetical protein
MVSQELHVTQKLLAIDLIQETQIFLRREIEEESKAVVVRPQRFSLLPCWSLP